MNKSENKSRSTVDILRQCFSAYEKSERAILENVLSDDLEFISPHDPSLNKKSYFEKCWPFNQKVKSYKFLKVLDKGNEVFVIYKYQTYDGDEGENAEFFEIENGKG